MKRAKHLRSLEELWKLEDRHPLLDASATGLMRWMFATGMLAGSAADHRSASRRKTDATRRTGNGRS
jgi:hypothetical protein